MSDYRAERLRSEHMTNFFDCGQSSMDKWLEKSALKDQDLGISCTHVWVDASGEMVVGYYTLLPTVVRETTEEASLWARLKPSKQYWGDEVYGVLIGKLALDKDLQGKKLSLELLGDAVLSAIEAITLIGGVYVVIEPMNNEERLRRLYERYGFVSFADTNRMFLSVPDFCKGTPI